MGIYDESLFCLLSAKLAKLPVLSQSDRRGQVARMETIKCYDCGSRKIMYNN